MMEKTLLKQRKYHLKTYLNCFIGIPVKFNKNQGSEVVNFISDWEQKFIEMKEENQIIEYFQLLIDLGAVQHITEPQKRFTNSGNFYRFSIPLNNKEMKDAFISSTTHNFNQFKLVQNFISNRNNVCQLFNSMKSNYEGFEFFNHKVRNKVFDEVFQGYEMINWIKEKYTSLDNFGAILLAECMRQLRAFDGVKSTNCFQNGQVFYVMNNEKQFENALRLIYEHTGGFSTDSGKSSILTKILALLKNSFLFANSAAEEEIDEKTDSDEEIDVNTEKVQKIIKGQKKLKK
jgi:hypothetical protein